MWMLIISLRNSAGYFSLKVHILQLSFQLHLTVLQSLICHQWINSNWSIWNLHDKLSPITYTISIEIKYLVPVTRTFCKTFGWHLSICFTITSAFSPSQTFLFSSPSLTFCLSLAYDSGYFPKQTILNFLTNKAQQCLRLDAVRHAVSEGRCKGCSCFPPLFT